MSESAELNLTRRWLDATAASDADALEAILAPDYEEIYPQSGERIAGRGAAIELIRRHPARPRPASDVHLTSLGGGWHVVEAMAEEGADAYWLVALLEFRDGRLLRERAYFPAPFEVPAWRADLVERVDPGDPSLWPTEGDGLTVTREAVGRALGSLATFDRAETRAVLHPDWTTWYPQSGERHDIAAEERIDAAYPGGLPDQRVTAVRGGDEAWVVNPMNQPVQVSGGTDRWVGEGVFRYPAGDLWHLVAVGLFRDRRLWHSRFYFAEPFAPPAWRADLVS
jgi:ketosteroid isomerase-like protein